MAFKKATFFMPKKTLLLSGLNPLKPLYSNKYKQGLRLSEQNRQVVSTQAIKWHTFKP
ncbi:MAG TPA: hypothetical protein VK032_02480 [Burkholderiaceae bacterium]|nr:hypothetical protein [Burkholderiaceae bacterium]